MMMITENRAATGGETGRSAGGDGGGKTGSDGGGIGGGIGVVAGVVARAVALVRAIARPDLVELAARVALAVPFWKSGLLKWSGFLQLADTAVYLFSDEFKLHLPGGPYPFPAPAAMAFAAGCAEIVLPILLVIGFGARFAAAGLLVMTAVVQLTVPDGWPIHLTWAALALAVMAWGPGRWSLDHWIWTSLQRPPRR
ncbi:MAG: DoxX family protein [Lautropia sp.]